MALLHGARKAKYIAMIGLLALCTVTGGTVGATDGPRKGGTVVLVTQFENFALDLYKDFNSSTVRHYQMIYDQLVRRDPNTQEFVPGLATSWEASPDHLTWTFKLRKGVTFHDGTPFNAAAVKANFDRVDDPKLGAAKAKVVLDQIASITTPDEQTIVFRLKKPYAPFIAMLSCPFLSMVSPTAAAKMGAEFGDRPVGTGPFMVKEWVKQSHVTLVRNPNYQWGPEFLDNQGPPYVDEIIVKFVPEETAKIGALETGAAQMADYVMAKDVQRLQEAGFPTFVCYMSGINGGYRLNCKKFPTDELAVRQAIHYAIDRKAIMNSKFFLGQKLEVGVIPSYTWGYSAEVNKKYAYPYDPGKAQEILAQAGWKPGPDGILEKKGKRLELVVPSWGGQPQYEAIDQISQAMLKKIGIDVNIRRYEGGGVYEALGKDDYNMVIMNHTGPDVDMPMKQAFHSAFIEGNGGNWSKYSNPTLDAILDKAGTTMTPKERLALYAQAQQIVFQDSPIVPIVPMYTWYATVPELVGIKPDAIGYHYMNDAYFKK